MPTTCPSVEAAVERSDLVRKALVMAREAHAEQTRNASGGRPYIDHPMAVAERIAELGGGDEVLAAALLHDVVEDSELQVSDVREACGERVAAIVEALTDDEQIGSYEERKREHRARVAAAGADALAIYAADKLTNVEMLRDAYAMQGEDIAEELTVPLDVKIGVWDADLAMLERRAGGEAGLSELAARLSAQLAELSRSRDARAAAAPD